MASRKTLREQQLVCAERASVLAHQLVSASDPQRARDIRDAIAISVDQVVEIIETLARVEA